MEIARVRSLTGERSGWIKRGRVAGKPYKIDRLAPKRIPFLGKGAVKKFNECSPPITTFRKLAELTDKRITALAKKKVATKANILAWRKAAQDAEDEPTSSTDHRKAANPYQSRWGDEERLEGSSGMSRYVCVTTMVEHIFEETKEHMQEIHGEDCDDWWVYHDALSLMTATTTRAWMEEKGYLKHWILPECGLNTHTPKHKQYYSKAPVGNSPELMPWDCSLNKDFDDAISHHITQTHHLAEDHECKFSYTTPVRGSYCLRRVYECNPRSERIVQDVNRFPKHLVRIMESEGCVVRDIGNSKKEEESLRGLRSGKRGLAAAAAEEKDGVKVDRRGGQEREHCGLFGYLCYWRGGDKGEGCG
ncbi:hypothetical protein SEMRO_739_G195380.1 [Seminavis robusta]|uniref:Uncharacterized protein n=1 Tax=Seminavis robusta TaxID=568900 RepID=A0A9N8EC34_9STRA|nr:hypothetical protein SEMRO_739_G195380.1 [Seminavis robusta]|eukprot:Sro739_g195380.1 n/a (362) ;mRNA; r:10389-11545